jgi:hypothetical protein
VVAFFFFFFFFMIIEEYIKILKLRHDFLDVIYIKIVQLFTAENVVIHDLG